MPVRSASWHAAHGCAFRFLTRRAWLSTTYYGAWRILALPYYGTWRVPGHALHSSASRILARSTLRRSSFLRALLPASSFLRISCRTKRAELHNTRTNHALHSQTCYHNHVHRASPGAIPVAAVRRSMLLAIDMGNTQTALGLFDREELVQSWRMPTDRTFTADEIHMRLIGYLQMYQLEVTCIDEIAFAGVVPQLSREWRAVADRVASQCVAIGPDTAAVTKVHAPNPSEIGADRIANAVAADTFYGAPAIVVDFGTATNIDVVDADGYYIGGAIAPGLRISMDALVARAARIASIPLEMPAHAIGRTTTEAVQSGAVIGTAAMAEGLVRRIKDELAAPHATVIATGGLAPLVADSTAVFDVLDGQLTLKGIAEICRRMRDERTW